MNKQFFKNLCSSFRALRREYGESYALVVINRYNPSDVDIIRRVYGIPIPASE